MRVGEAEHAVRASDPAAGPPGWSSVPSVLAAALPAVVAGLTATMTAILFVRAPGDAPAELRLTGYGRWNFRPEYDTRFFYAGAALTLTAVLARAWLRRRRPPRALAIVPAWALVGGAVAVAALGTGWWLWAFMDGHGIVYGGGQPGARHLAVLAAATVTCVLASWAAGRAAPRPASGGPPRPAGWSVLDVAVPLLVAAAIFVPGWRAYAGDAWLGESFFSWDFFAMGPALGFREGAGLPTQMYAPYGIGWPALFGAVAGIVPLSYGHLIAFATAWGAAWFAGLYALVRLLSRSAGWAAAGVLIALYLHLCSGVAGHLAVWRFPSVTLMRRPLDVAVLLLLVAHARTGRTGWAVASGALSGLAVVLVTDSGLYLAMTAGAGLLWSAVALRRRWTPLVWAAGAGALTAAAGLVLASRGTVLEPGFWELWLRPLLDGGRGYTALPLAGPAALFDGAFTVDTPAMVLFAAATTTYLAAAAVALARTVGRRAGPDEVVCGTLALYGLIALVHFVGRSDPINLAHLLVPFAALLAVAGAAAHGAVRPPVGRAGSAAWRAVPCAAFVAAAAALAANPLFRTYPGLLQTGAPAPDGTCLMDEPRDVCGLPPAAGARVADFRAAADGIRRLSGDGATVALLDYEDTALYLASGVRPWAPYSPLLPNLFRQADVERVERTLRTHPPAFVLLRPLEENPLYLSDVRRQLRATVTATYTHVGEAGPFEIWARPGTVPPEG